MQKLRQPRRAIVLPHLRPVAADHLIAPTVRLAVCPTRPFGLLAARQLNMGACSPCSIVYHVAAICQVLLQGRGPATGRVQAASTAGAACWLSVPFHRPLGWWGRLMEQAAAPPVSPPASDSRRQPPPRAHPPLLVCPRSPPRPLAPQIALACAIAGVVAVKLVDVKLDVDVGNTVPNYSYSYSCLLGQDVGSSSLCT